MRPTRLLSALLALALSAPLVACGDDPTGPASVEETTFAPAFAIDLSAAGWTRLSSGLYYRTLSPGTGPTVTDRQDLVVRYTGWLADGRQFDSGDYPFTLGIREVIAGWDYGIVGMRVGEKRRLLIPSELGYGTRGNGPIPGNAVLVFDVEVLSAT